MVGKVLTQVLLQQSVHSSMMQHLNEEEDDEVPILQDLDLISIGERSTTDGVVDDDITKNNLNNDLPANNNTNQHHQQLPRVPVTILTGFLGSGT